MATYRIGIGSFNLKDGAVGLGTESSGLGNLKVEGTFKTTDLDITTGIATFTRYAGFAADDLNINRDTSLTGEHSTQGDIVVGLNSTFTVSTGATVTVGTVESVSIGTHFSPPIGGMEDRPEAPVEGTVRFNEDLNTLEFYNGVDWRQFTVSGNNNTSNRGVFTGGYQASTATGRMEAINISSSGNTTYFGELVYTVRDCGAMGNRIRGLVEGTTNTNQIQYWTFATESNGLDFGDLTETKGTYNGSLASSTRGVWAGGWGGGSTKDTIEYVEIMTLGNGIDFGNLSVGARSGMAGCSNGTRGLFMGGHDGTFVEEIEQITISSKGNTIDFGKMSGGLQNLMCAGNTVRAIHGGGIDNDGTASNILEYITIASSGNATEFGDLITNRHQGYGVANQTRAVFASGSAPNHANLTDLMEYVNISSLGNGVDFGGTTTMKCDKASAASNCHGGLGGY